MSIFKASRQRVYKSWNRAHESIVHLRASHVSKEKDLKKLRLDDQRRSLRFRRMYG